jgi:hypothetical protein
LERKSTSITGRLIYQEVVMNIKIVKCHDQRLWYADRVGETFGVVESSVNPFWWVVNDGTVGRYAVLKTDCRSIKAKLKSTLICGRPEEVYFTRNSIDYKIIASFNGRKLVDVSLVK